MDGWFIRRNCLAPGWRILFMLASPALKSESAKEVPRMTATRSAIRKGIHAFVFLVAAAVFYFGLGVGLSVNPFWGTLLWIAAFAIAGLNLAVILLRWPRR